LSLANQRVYANSVTGILTEHARLWRYVGFKLGLLNCVLDNIEADSTKQRDRFEKTLNCWLMQAGEDATWGVLELAITNANREFLGLPSLLKCKFHIHKHKL